MSAIDPRLHYHHGPAPLAPPPPPPPPSYAVRDLRQAGGRGHVQASSQAPRPPTPPPSTHHHPPSSAPSSAQQHPHGTPLYQLHPVNHPHPILHPDTQQQLAIDPTLNEEDNESVGVDDSGDGSPQDSTAQPGLAGKAPEKRPRACDSCRGLKVKCIIDPASKEPCKRCAKARRQCIVTPPTRKRQKKADGRVADLERKIDALTASLAAREASVYEGGIQLDQLKSESLSPYALRSPQSSADQRLSGKGPQSPPDSRSGHRPNEGPDKRRRLEGLTSNPTATSTPGDGPSMMPTPSSDPEGRGSIYNQRKAKVFDHSDINGIIDSIIDTETAERLFNRYVNVVMPRFPAVPFPKGTPASDVRQAKPILFLAILSSTSYGSGVSKEAQTKLEAELRDVFAKAMWKNGEKSLEIVQALHVATLWYRPPLNFEQHMFYQMVHMSAVMAVDIGIGKRLSPWRLKWFGTEPPPRRVPHYYASIEAKRAWVVSYFLCISITMILRRPILVRFTDYLKECIEILENSEDALPSDKVLCQHVRLAHISEDVATQFAMDDPAINYTISDNNVSFSIKHYEKELAEIREPGNHDYALRLAKHVTNLYLHEIALHSQNNVDDFKGPWISEEFKTSVSDIVLGTEHIRALTACQQACKDILDTFLSYDFEIVYVLPVIFTGVRVIYAVVVIIKLYIAANSPGEMASVIKKEDLQVEQYLNRLQKLFKAVMDKDPMSPHVKFLWVLERLQERWDGIKSGQTTICRSTGKSTPVSTYDPRLQADPPRSVPAQGLHLLSEVAVGNNQAAGGVNGTSMHDNANSSPMTDPSLLSSAAHNQHASHQHQQQQQQLQNQHTNWYAPQQQHSMGQMPMDPSAYLYSGGMPSHDSFDYGIGSLGLGMDGAISGLFMGDGMWSFATGATPDSNGSFQGWQ